MNKDALVNSVAHAIMETRVRWGWTFGKRRRVMAIDLLMAGAAIKALSASRLDMTEINKMFGWEG